MGSPPPWGVQSSNGKIQTVVNNLDTMGETRLLTDGKIEQLEKARDDLIKLLREEQLKFYQHAKATGVLLGIIIQSIFR